MNHMYRYFILILYDPKYHFEFQGTVIIPQMPILIYRSWSKITGVFLNVELLFPMHLLLNHLSEYHVHLFPNYLHLEKDHKKIVPKRADQHVLYIYMVTISNFGCFVDRLDLQCCSMMTLLVFFINELQQFKETFNAYLQSLIQFGNLNLFKYLKRYSYSYYHKLKNRNSGYQKDVHRYVSSLVGVFLLQQ